MDAAVRETHTAVVVLLGERAYKVKKPVSLGFVDLSTPAARRAACEREVALNRRLAPDVYLGVARLLDVDGEPCEDLVVMRRLPDEARLSHLALSGAPLEAAMRQLAHQLAAFHAAAARGPSIDAAATAASMTERFEENARRLDEIPPELHDPARAARLLALARFYLAGRRPLFDERVVQGKACDGHGDLLADDIFLLDDGPRVLDCLEFDDALRYGDVLGDVAFLAMDLERLGRPDLGRSLLERYAELADDHWPDSLAHLHVAYRAQVRALVAAVRARQGGGGEGAARALLELAIDHLEAGAIHLVVVGGPPGSGKSTLADGLAAAIGAVVLRSDELRKQAAGFDPLARAGTGLDEGLYAPEATEATYGELVERARTCLGHGLSVVLDATFADARWRSAAARLAREGAAILTELRCSLPPETAARRIAARAGRDASDATAEVASAIAARAAPWPTAAVIDTSGDPAKASAAALATVRKALSLRFSP